MTGVNSPLRPSKSLSLSRLGSLSPSQITARKLVRKYSLGSRMFSQRRELSALRTSLPNVKAASDLDVVLSAIKYIESLQSQVIYLSQNGNQNGHQFGNINMSTGSMMHPMNSQHPNMNSQHHNINSQHHNINSQMANLNNQQTNLNIQQNNQNGQQSNLNMRRRIFDKEEVQINAPNLNLINEVHVQQAQASRQLIKNGPFNSSNILPNNARFNTSSSQRQMSSAHKFSGRLQKVPEEVEEEANTKRLPVDHKRQAANRVLLTLHHSEPFTDVRHQKENEENNN